MSKRSIWSTLLVAAIGGLIALGGQYILMGDYGKAPANKHQLTQYNEQPAKDSNARYVSANNMAAGKINFQNAVKNSVDAVVHVKTMRTRQGYGNMYDFFFGKPDRERGAPVMGAGSGVIVSEDGYIVTNNHVVEKSEEIQVVMNDRNSYKAKIIGADPTTDLALIKIEADKPLPTINYGSSDKLKIGEWVLAVGNPFNLTSTVTAGIVSAKARHINLLKQEYAIESFIQTDAAVNPGNSGGALVNKNGELVGINTAIASKTGSFSGYSFAVPVSIVKKVVADLIEYGAVQRAMLGVQIANVNDQVAKKFDLKNNEGIFVAGVAEEGSAKEAGIQRGDVILEVNGNKMNKVSQLQEHISQYSPGQKVEIKIKRNGTTKNLTVTLKNMQGTTDVIRREKIDMLGAEFEMPSDEEKERLNISNGVKVVNLSSGKLLKAGVREGFIITYINRKPVKNLEDLRNMISNAEGGVYIEGIYPNGVTAYYAFGVR